MKVRLFQILYILINIYFASDFQRMQFFRLTCFFFWPHHEACGILVPSQGLNLRPLHCKCSRNLWTARDVPTVTPFSFYYLDVDLSFSSYCFQQKVCCHSFDKFYFYLFDFALSRHVWTLSRGVRALVPSQASDLPLLLEWEVGRINPWATRAVLAVILCSSVHNLSLFTDHQI